LGDLQVQLPPLIPFVWDAVLFVLVTIGGGIAAAPRRVQPAELSLAAGLAAWLGAMFVVGFTAFAVHASNRAAAIAVTLSWGVLLVSRRKRVAEILREPGCRTAIASWLVLAGWALGLLACVVTYSGGGWAVDWFEHWQRTLFFVDRQPLTTTFADYAFTARPPLVNMLVALFLAGTIPSFAHYQVFMTLLGSLVVFPAIVLALGWRTHFAASGQLQNTARRCAWLVTLLLMVNPLVAQNLTFAWTKLPTAFFVLTALALLQAGLMRPAGEHSTTEHGFGALAWSGAMLGLAVLAHYSAGPWVIASGVAAFWFLRANRDSGRKGGRELAGGSAVFVGLVALWLGWSLATYGWSGTVHTNSTSTAWQTQTLGQKLTVPLRNLYDTLVPFPLRGEPRDGLIAQVSSLGRLRDVWFSLYQVNLPLSVGLGGLWLLGNALVQRRRRPIGAGASPFWLPLLVVVIPLGVFVHTARDRWGLTHICLQPLVLLGLCAAAGWFPLLSSRARGWWAALAAIDVLQGIVLHFGLESWRLAKFVMARGNGAGYLDQLALVARVNARDKFDLHTLFFGDLFIGSGGVVLLWLALCLGVAIFQASRGRVCERGGF
jgi:hypothetical protein